MNKQAEIAKGFAKFVFHRQKFSHEIKNYLKRTCQIA